MKKLMASVLAVAFLATGCTGSFNLTRKVYNFHRSQSDKWADELCFLLVTLIPIYSLATFADAIVFNSIEFWSGNNPVTMASGAPQERIVQNGKEKYKMTYDAKTDQVTLTSIKNPQEKMIFERSDKMVTAKNEKGEVLYSSVQTDKGDVSVFDGNGKLMKNYPADQLAMVKDQYLVQK